MLTARTHLTTVDSARSLLLDLLAQQERAGQLAIAHPALEMDGRDFAAAWTSLRDDGLAYGVEGEPLRLTDAGREAHAAAEFAVEDVAIVLPPPSRLPSLTSALGRRAALFGAVVSSIASCGTRAPAIGRSEVHAGGRRG